MLVGIHGFQDTSSGHPVQLYSGSLAQPDIAMQVCWMGVLSRMLALMCLGRASGPVLGILVVNAEVKRHIQHAVRPPLAVHCNAVARAGATGWPWFQISISRYTPSRT